MASDSENESSSSGGWSDVGDESDWNSVGPSSASENETGEVSKETRDRKLPESKRTSNRKEKQYTCDLCNKKLLSFATLMYHTRSHILGKRYNCDMCDVGFFDITALKKHIASCHTSVKSLVKFSRKRRTLISCKECGKRYRFGRSLEKHMTLHSNIAHRNSRSKILMVEKRKQSLKSFRCKFCQEIFGTMKEKNKHLTVHYNEMKFKCELCPYACMQNAALESHMRTHTGEKPFKCHVCDKCYGFQKALDTHINTHIGLKPFPCRYCEVSFYYVSHRKRHECIHTGERPYKCNVCQAAFIENTSLKYHMKRLHETNDDKAMTPREKEMSSTCEICFKSFLRPSKLARHMPTHTGDKPFSCHVCNKCFAHKSSLSTHCRKVHDKEKPDTTQEQRVLL